MLINEHFYNAGFADTPPPYAQDYGRTVLRRALELKKLTLPVEKLVFSLLWPGIEKHNSHLCE
jgi:hypothetical protein